MNKIEQVREAIEACIDRLPDIPSYQKCKAALAILKDMDGQGPVAWMYKGGDSRYPAYLTLEKDIAEEDADDPSSIIPLYAHPSPTASDAKDSPVDVQEVIRAGDNLDHKFIDLVAFCAAHIPENKLQDLVDDWAGHDERNAWTTATAKHRTA